MPSSSQTTDQWWINDQTPDNPYGKSDDYDAYLDYLGALNRSLTPEIAAGTLRINVQELNDHPEYKAAAVGALTMWASVTPLKFEIVDDTPFDPTTDWMQVVSPELGEETMAAPIQPIAMSASVSGSTIPNPTRRISAAMCSIPSFMNLAMNLVSTIPAFTITAAPAVCRSTI